MLAELYKIRQASLMQENYVYGELQSFGSRSRRSGYRSRLSAEFGSGLRFPITKNLNEFTVDIATLTSIRSIKTFMNPDSASASFQNHWLVPES
jgi:hypothetical protein